jgi:hypothetical protein
MELGQPKDSRIKTSRLIKTLLSKVGNCFMATS